jgi:hypothetical protein
MWLLTTDSMEIVGGLQKVVGSSHVCIGFVGDGGVGVLPRETVSMLIARSVSTSVK